MKVLLSAFNCNPDKGSEYGRGWAWVTELTSRGHEIWVITESKNQPAIERFLSNCPIPNCHFIYHPLPPSSNAWWKFKGKQIGELNRRLALEWNLFMWQWQAYQKAKKLVQQVDFDYVHHVTNTCVRRYSLMGLLGVPFILGPLSGGLNTPWKLRKSYSLLGWTMELLRDFSNGLVRLNPLMRLTFAKAIRIYCDSPQTQALLGSYQAKSQVLFSMPQSRMKQASPVSEPSSTQAQALRVLYAGRFIYWKGLHLGLRAFAQLYQSAPDSRLTLIGQGPEDKRLRKLAEQLGIDQAVVWIDWVDQQELSLAYFQHDVLLFPSLHEMGGNVVMEALAHGLPVACFDLGGPGVMVNETCGRVVKTNELTEEAAVQSLGNVLIELANDPELRQRLSQGALARQSQFSWSNVVEQIYPQGKSCTENLSPDLSPAASGAD